MAILHLEMVKERPNKGGAIVTLNLEHRKICIERAKKMRRVPTEAEAELWERLKEKQLKIRFIRQHVIFGRIADFCAPSIGLIVEVDGGYHDTQKDSDIKRDKQLKRLGGYHTIRFTNEQVLKEIDLVIIKILAEVIKGLKLAKDGQKKDIL